MKRGDVVTIAWTGDYGKPRPAVVVQSDNLADSDTVLLCQMTSSSESVAIRRITVLPDEWNGLRKPSQVMVEKMFAVKRDKVGPVIGRLDLVTRSRLNEALALVIGLLDD